LSNIIAIEVVALTEESLMKMDNVILPNESSPAIVNMASIVQIPSRVLLNQMRIENQGTVHSKSNKINIEIQK